MGHYVVDPEDVEPAPDRPSEMRYISEAVGMENMGLRIYDVAPGEDLPVVGLHSHDVQEEAFYVVEGELSVETPDEEYVVERNQFFIAKPNNAHRTYNSPDAEENARVVAMGAPRITK